VQLCKFLYSVCFDFCTGKDTDFKPELTATKKDGELYEDKNVAILKQFDLDMTFGPSFGKCVLLQQ